MEKNPNLRRSCYEGIGTIAPAGADQQGSKAAVLCEATSKSKLYQLYCTSFAANSMTILVNKQEGYNACDGLDGESREYCNAYAENRSNILLPHDPPKDLL
jgi:hypothetical protein